jgi:hypothetical protein
MFAARDVPAGTAENWRPSSETVLTTRTAIPACTLVVMFPDFELLAGPHADFARHHGVAPQHQAYAFETPRLVAVVGGYGIAACAAGWKPSLFAKLVTKSRAPSEDHGVIALAFGDGTRFRSAEFNGRSSSRRVIA